MKKFTEEGLRAWWEINDGQFPSWPRAAELYAETLKDETMSVEEIENFLHHKSWQSKKGLAQIIKPLTIQQGFTPDWEEAPVNTTGWSPYWVIRHAPVTITHPIGPIFHKPYLNKTNSELLSEITESLKSNSDIEKLIRVCEFLRIKVTK